MCCLLLTADLASSGKWHGTLKVGANTICKSNKNMNEVMMQE